MHSLQGCSQQSLQDRADRSGFIIVGFRNAVKMKITERNISSENKNRQISHFSAKNEKCVGSSNILDRELCWGEPVKWSHGQVVRATAVDSKLLCKVLERIERAARVEPLLILTVASLHLAVVPRRVRANEFMPDAQFSSRPLKQRRHIALATRKTVGKLGTVVRLDTFHLYASAGVLCSQLPQEVRRGISGLLRIGRQKAQTCELVNGSVLEQPKLRIRDALARHDLHIHLNALTGVGHLLIRLWLICIFRLFGRKQPHFTHDTEQTFRAAGVAALPQTVPELEHTQGWIPAAQIADELQLGLRVLVGVAVGPSGLAGKGRHTSIPALLPEIDVRPALVVLPAGAADVVFLCVLH